MVSRRFEMDFVTIHSMSQNGVTPAGHPLPLFWGARIKTRGTLPERVLSEWRFCSVDLAIPNKYIGEAAQVQQFGGA